jgi:hypothetical protein
MNPITSARALLQQRVRRAQDMVRDTPGTVDSLSVLVEDLNRLLPILRDENAPQTAAVTEQVLGSRRLRES